jgi:hypothetical protein
MLHDSHWTQSFQSCHRLRYRELQEIFILDQAIFPKKNRQNRSRQCCSFCGFRDYTARLKHEGDQVVKDQLLAFSYTRNTKSQMTATADSNLLLLQSPGGLTNHLIE